MRLVTREKRYDDADNDCNYCNQQRNEGSLRGVLSHVLRDSPFFVCLTHRFVVTEKGPSLLEVRHLR